VAVIRDGGLATVSDVVVDLLPDTGHQGLGDGELKGCWPVCVWLHSLYIHGSQPSDSFSAFVRSSTLCIKLIDNGFPVCITKTIWLLYNFEIMSCLTLLF